jgi:hypothetical protein
VWGFPHIVGLKNDVLAANILRLRAGRAVEKLFSYLLIFDNAGLYEPAPTLTTSLKIAARERVVAPPRVLANVSNFATHRVCITVRIILAELYYTHINTAP